MARLGGLTMRSITDCRGKDGFVLNLSGLFCCRRSLAGVRGLRVFMACMLTMTTGGCGAFNPAFLNLFDVSGTGQFITIDNAPGHVILTVINNATIDERLLDFLESKLTLSDVEKRNLNPRIRMRLRVTFIDGNFQTIEFITGSPNFVDPTFGAQAVPDLNQNDLSNAVVLCDVASVQLEPGSEIEVFIPVELQEFDRVEVINQAGGVFRFLQLRGSIQPQFRTLQRDDLDEDDNVILQRNIGVRDVLGPVTNLLCGSVVAVVINGVLSVPFLDGFSEPSFDRGDPATTASIGGRYEFRISIQ